LISDHGFEYKLVAKLPSAEVAKNLLLNAPNFVKFDEKYQMAEYRIFENSGEMPDVVAKAEDYGFYLRDCGNRNLAYSIIGYLSLNSPSFGTVEFSELE
jgi:hypothetical protein